MEGPCGGNEAWQPIPTSAEAQLATAVLRGQEQADQSAARWEPECCLAPICSAQPELVIGMGRFR